jgi:hypothetical protein
LEPLTQKGFPSRWAEDTGNNAFYFLQMKIVTVPVLSVREEIQHLLKVNP